ncbi:outer membrane beta-barrel protein [Pedobacter riviphilus]|uniref:Outer membrane beta-barrel protein n=1 Tax=Pedobacter riviphilus TaxID=2766984 RepID=A0ABX6TCD7_9SPHI|nr:outer membrane beta-barrel protein [Pedobacter riviphilus]QNR83133.1 outer membrane beta-barrel protein [Pedobacter riviphilus]
MRNSAWYHKLWRNKFDSLPIQDAADASWAGMHKLLNEQMPISTIGGHGPNLSTGAKLFKIIGYTLSVAATVSTVGYFTVLKSKNKHKEIEKKVKPAILDSIVIDSSKVINYNNLGDTTVIKDSIDQNGNAINDVVVQNRGVDNDSAQVVKGVNDNENLISSAVKPNAVSQNKHDGTQKRDNFGRFENLSSRSLKLSSKVDDHEPKGRNIDRSFMNGQNLLLIPDSYQETNGFFKRGVSPVSILNQGIVLQTYAPVDLQSTSSIKNSRRGSNNKADRATASKTPKVKNIKSPKIKTTKIKQESEIIEPTYSYGVTTGMNVQKENSSFYAGIFGTYALSKKWKLAVGVNVNSYQKIIGEFTHPSYYRPDSLPPFTITATRKVITVDVPLMAAYRLSKHISVKAGPVISFVGKQSEMITRLNPIADPRDTLYHSKQIDSTLVNTVSNKINIGFTGGISIHIKQFDINGSYQWLTPYKVSNSLGSFKQTNQVFRIGIGYRFK